MNKVEEYIPKALEAVKEKIASKDGKVAKEYNGYISSFGASIRQAGILPTVLFFENRNAGSQEDRSKVLRAIEYILGIGEGQIRDVALKKKKDIEAAAVALKLALRTFKLEGQEKNEQRQK